jgi:hypothetical protein
MTTQESPVTTPQLPYRYSGSVARISSLLVTSYPQAALLSFTVYQNTEGSAAVEARTASGLLTSATPSHRSCEGGSHGETDALSMIADAEGPGICDWYSIVGMFENDTTLVAVSEAGRKIMEAQPRE